VKDFDARMLTGKLVAAFPGARVSVETGEVYAEEFARLDSPDLLRRAIDDLIRSEDRLPSVAAVRRGYRIARQRAAQARADERGLDEPGPSHAPTPREILAAFDRYRAENPDEETGPFTKRAIAYFRDLPPDGPIPPEAEAELLAELQATESFESEADSAVAIEEPETDPGRCSDCRRVVSGRRVYGSFRVCASCFARRQRVSASLEQGLGGGIVSGGEEGE
jgi:hypothetical protein